MKLIENISRFERHFTNAKKLRDIEMIQHLETVKNFVDRVKREAG